MQTTHASRRYAARRYGRSQAARGFGLVEIVVTVAIIAMISAAVTVGIMKIAERQKISLTRTNGETLRTAVKMWRATENESGCPSVPNLIADGMLDRGKAARTDAWGQPWVIECQDFDATIVSAGPDKLPDTEDDIRVPPV
ncbi:MAG TPA: type II secretion system protein [Polyangiaceae bacterium]|nr:type II secretion system protein [Polyangiaceae bacterium]